LTDIYWHLFTAVNCSPPIFNKQDQVTLLTPIIWTVMCHFAGMSDKYPERLLDSHVAVTIGVIIWRWPWRLGDTTRWHSNRNSKKCNWICAAAWWPHPLLSVNEIYHWQWSDNCCNITGMVTILTDHKCDKTHHIWYTWYMLQCCNSKQISKQVHLCLYSDPCSLNCHGGTMVLFHKLCTTARSSRVHCTKLSLQRRPNSCILQVHCVK